MPWSGGFDVTAKRETFVTTGTKASAPIIDLIQTADDLCRPFSRQILITSRRRGVLSE